MTVDHHVFNKTTVTCETVNWCSYSRWSPYFSELVPDAKIFSPLPQPFIDYLNSESIAIPQQLGEITQTSDNEYSDWEDEEPNQIVNPFESFQDFHDELTNLVKEWKQVMVKLNWSAPKDAKWILINNTIQSTSTSDIYLLLNASDHIAHDLDKHIYEECEDQDDGKRMDTELVIKKWIPDFNPALEFRLFIKNRRILGASQRDLNYYLFLHDIQDELKAVMDDFQKTVLKETQFPLKDFVLDVFIARPYKKVTILDINPFTRKWDSLLFTWHELLEKENDGNFELRLITETNKGRLAQKDHSESQVPIEVVGAAVDGNAMIELAKEWLALGAAGKRND